MGRGEALWRRWRWRRWIHPIGGRRCVVGRGLRGNMLDQRRCVRLRLVRGRDRNRLRAGNALLRCRLFRWSRCSGGWCWRLGLRRCHCRGVGKGWRRRWWRRWGWWRSERLLLRSSGGGVGEVGQMKRRRRRWWWRRRWWRIGGRSNNTSRFGGDNLACARNRRFGVGDGCDGVGLRRARGRHTHGWRVILTHWRCWRLRVCAGVSVRRFVFALIIGKRCFAIIFGWLGRWVVWIAVWIEWCSHGYSNLTRHVNYDTAHSHAV